MNKRQRTYQLRYCTQTGADALGIGRGSFEQVELREVIVPEDCADKEAWITDQICDLAAVSPHELAWGTDALSDSVPVYIRDSGVGALVWITPRSYRKLPRSYCRHASEVAEAVAVR